LCHALSWISFEAKHRQARRVISNELFSASYIVSFMRRCTNMTVPRQLIHCVPIASHTNGGRGPALPASEFLDTSRELARGVNQ
jgi:hypothetical protein